jgi:hypothetical protein
MVSVEIYRPEQWHDFFLLVGTGAVTLTGLIFVALTIHLRSITQDIVHRSRALSSLTGLTAAFLQCAIAMLPEQSHKKLGIELMILATISLSVFLWGIYRTFRTGVNPISYSHWRTLEGTFMYLTEIIGAGVFISGHIVGLYIVVLGLLANLLFIVSGAWLLVVGPTTKS